MLAYIFVIIALLFRALNVSGLPLFVFHFTPVGASLLYFGARQPRKRMWIPVAALALSDVLLNMHYGQKFTADLPVTFVWYAAMILLGGVMLGKEAKPLRIGAASLVASVSFYLVSNFMVWAVWGDMYPRTLGGLVQCYVAALPFFRNTVASDLIFSAAFFGAAYLLKQNEGEAVDRTAAA